MFVFEIRLMRFASVDFLIDLDQVRVTFFLSRFSDILSSISHFQIFIEVRSNSIYLIQFHRGLNGRKLENVSQIINA